jgi:hypothetical protein
LRDHPTSQHRTVWLESLPGHLQAELVDSGEHGQVRTGEARPRGSVRHVEVFRMGSVRAFILGRPRRLSSHRRAGPGAGRHYTLICEEPDMAAALAQFACRGFEVA